MHMERSTDTVVYYGDIPVGAITCRFEAVASVQTLTILTLAYVA